MTATKTRLYKSLKPCVRKEDHAELARMLQMVWDSPDSYFMDEESRQLMRTFVWSMSPQGAAYWSELSLRLREAGYGDVA